MDNQKFLELTMIFFFIILPILIAAIGSISLITYIYSSNRDKNNQID